MKEVFMKTYPLNRAVRFSRRGRPGSAYFLAAAFLFLAVAGSADALSAVNVYPNPVRAALGQTTVTFDHLEPGTRLRIYDVQGVLVRDVSLEEGSTSFVWDLTNDAGRSVAGGVFFYRLHGPSGARHSGKIAVIK